MTVRDPSALSADVLAEPPEPDPAGSAPPRRPGAVRGVLALLRNTWRRLTSMRTALILLFLLAVASLPGALLPQWSLNPAKTAQYILDHGWWGQLLNRLGFFEVFAAPWYAAIYLLLFTSLVGCLVPRCWEFVTQLRAPPVSTPRNLSRLPLHAVESVAADPTRVADGIERGLRGWRRTRRSEPGGVLTISAEKGYLREVGNLLFHFSLLGLLVAIALGKLFGYEGSVILQAGGPGSGMCLSSPGGYDNFRPGLLVDGTDLVPLCVQVDSFRAEYTPAGQATSFRAAIRYQVGPSAAAATSPAESAGATGGAGATASGWTSTGLEVNDPLRVDGARLYLLGHGYSPTFTVRYPDGSTQVASAAFQPADSMFTSQGAVKFTDPPGYSGQGLREHQLAVVGIFAPSAFLHGGIMTSTYPAAEQPGVAIDIYRGDLGMEAGRAQSVFAIDQGQVDSGALKKVARKNLAMGESVTLDDGTTVTFSGLREWVSLQTSYDPAQGWALVCAALLLTGLLLSLTIKRRRVWFRIGPMPAPEAPGADPPGPRPDGPAGVPAAVSPACRVEVGGLARTDQAGYGSEFGTLTALPRAAADEARSSVSGARRAGRAGRG